MKSHGYKEEMAEKRRTPPLLQFARELSISDDRSGFPETRTIYSTFLSMFTVMRSGWL
jgi:hypothetical protein